MCNDHDTNKLKGGLCFFAVNDYVVTIYARMLLLLHIINNSNNPILLQLSIITFA